MTTLEQAHREWATRSPDERFSSLQEMDQACRIYRAQAEEQPGINVSDLHIEVAAPEGKPRPRLLLPDGYGYDFSHYSFGQLCRHVGAPASYMRQLTPSLAATNLNYGLCLVDSGRRMDLLTSVNGSRKLRCLTSDRYQRIWNSDITSRLLRLTERAPEWQPAPAAFDGSRGLYASDQDMFAFLVDNERRIFESDPNGGLGRGFFVWNSEVGASSFGIMTFFYEFVCGNHRVWGASGVAELRIRHVGNADDRAFQQLGIELRHYADRSAADDETKIMLMKTTILGQDKEKVLDTIFGLRIPELTRKVLSDSFDRAEEHADWYGDPRSAWGLSGGITEIARDLPNASDRVGLDRAAGKVMQLALR